MKKILVIGESCLDVYQYGSITRLAPEAPVPVFEKNGEKVESGGMAMNVYNNIKCLSNFKIKLLTNKNYENIKKTRFVDERTNYIVMRLDENDNNYQKIDIKNFDYSAFDVVVISDYNKGFLTKEEISYIANNSRISFLDTKKILGPWADSVTFIKINNIEYERTEDKITDNLRKKMIVTRGADGASYLNKTFSVPKVEIKDTSGAGDTFLAGLALKYVETNNIDVSIHYANECATSVVQKKGVAVV